MTRGEQAAILPAHHCLVKLQERRWPQPDGDFMDTSVTEKQRSDAEQKPVPRRQVWSTPSSTAQNDQLLLEQQILSDDGLRATAAKQLRDGNGNVDNCE